MSAAVTPNCYDNARAERSLMALAYGVLAGCAWINLLDYTQNVEVQKQLNRPEKPGECHIGGRTKLRVT